MTDIAICRRATSTKTRIETTAHKYWSTMSWLVEEQHPLKQGLKHTIIHAIVLNRNVEEQHPLKQGLKQTTKLFRVHFPGVEEQHPLKQGLKL